MLEGRLLVKLSEMSDLDITNALIGLSNPNLKHKFKLQKMLEGYVSDNLDSINLETATMLLSNYGEKTKGDKDIATKVFDRVHVAVQEQDPLTTDPKLVFE